MDRRQFLQTVATGACALAFPPAQAAEAAPFRLRYTLASSLYGGMPLATVLGEVKKAGATGIDLWPKKHGTQREELDTLGLERFAEMLRAEGVAFTGTTRYDLGPFGLTDEIAVVRKLGGSLIVTGGVGNYKLQGEALKTEVRGFVEKLKPHAAHALEAGVTLAIENHGNNLIDSPDSLRWLAELAPAGVGIALAPYHLPQDSEALATLIRDLGPRVVLFYAWEFGQGCTKALPKDEELQQLPGRGTLDFLPLLKALKAIEFRGPTEIFMHPTPRGIPILETADLVTGEINRARAFLAALEAKI